MQALVLAAGMGKRLGEYTRDNTKCMVPVNGTALIDRLLEQLSSLEISRVVMVVGYKGQKLMDYLGAHYPEALTERYKIAVEDGEDGWTLLNKAGRKRGFLISGGEVDTERMSRILLDEFRGGKLGRFTLETPGNNDNA